MIQLPDFSKAYDYENNFYLSCDNARISKLISQYELFKMINNLPGAVVECGIFKGSSFLRFAAFRDILGCSYSRKLIGFDIFGKFPDTSYEDDKKYLADFIKQAGEHSISRQQLIEILQKKNIKNYELIEGDITETVPEYIRTNPNLKISLCHLDVDIYEPSVTAIRHLWPKIVRGGVLMLDDYGIFPGETKAVDDFFSDDDIIILKHPFAMTPSFVIKR